MIKTIKTSFKTFKSFFKSEMFLCMNIVYSIFKIVLAFTFLKFKILTFL